eukprot:gene14543-16046_t
MATATLNSTWNANVWKNAMSIVCEMFKVPSLHNEQEQALREFFSGKDVFVNLPTGFGKSMIFQAIPVVADLLGIKPRNTSIVVVISPLIALMNDQVKYLQHLGISATSVTDENGDCTIEDIMNGKYTHIYGSPECLLSTSVWRGLFKCKRMQTCLVGVAVDEAHCISQWGLTKRGSKKGEVPFRRWYGNLGELRSLAPDHVKMIVITATATSKTRSAIFECLSLGKSTSCVARSPHHENLHYCFEYLPKEMELSVVFSDILDDIQQNGCDATRTIVYCQTRKQCGVLYRTFEVALGLKFYKESLKHPKKRLVEM